MSLTKSDLNKIRGIVKEEVTSLEKSDMDRIRSIVKEEIRENNKKLLEIFVTKYEFEERLDKFEERIRREFNDSIAALQDIVLELKSLFDTEFTIVTKKKLKDHAFAIGNHEGRIRYLEAE